MKNLGVGKGAKVAVLGLALMLGACKVDLDGKLTVVDQENGLRLVTKLKDGSTLYLPFAEMRAELQVDSKEGKTSYLVPYLRKNGKKYRPKIPLMLPKVNDLLVSNDPVKVDADKLGQTFGMMVMRQIRPGKDLYTVTFHNPEFDTTLAKMTFEFKPKKALYDEDRREFLASYQNVKRKHRAAVFKIDGDVENMISIGKKFGWLEKAVDHIVNYGGMLLISPWMHARYSSVKWIIGDGKSRDKTQEKWNDVISKYPVIDYFAYVHDGDQHAHGMQNSSLKKNQLRLMYTGACNSGSSKSFITEYGAAAAGGHRNISASPFWQFNVVKKWTYGFSFEDSAIMAWKSGVRKAKALEFISFAKFWQDKNGFMMWRNVDEMIEDSEISISYTDEVPAKYLKINQSAVIRGKAGVDVPLREKRVTHLIAEKNGEAIIED